MDLIHDIALTMENKLFVGSLPWAIDDAKLGELFAGHGEVVSARVVTDKESGRSRGFGFVEFSSEEEAKAAVEAMDGATVEGRTITVSVAKPKAE